MIRLMFILFCALTFSSFCTTKKEVEIVNLTLARVVKREKLERTCYKDSAGVFTIGFGTNFHKRQASNFTNYCERKIEELKHSIISRDYLNRKTIKDYKPLDIRLLTTEYLMNKIIISEEEAKRYAKEHIKAMLVNFQNKKVNGYYVYDLLSSVEISELLSNIYNRGERVFYKKSDLWLIHVRNFVINRINKESLGAKGCVRMVEAFVSDSKNRPGIFNRRMDEARGFLDNTCPVIDHRLYLQMMKRHCKSCII